MIEAPEELAPGMAQPSALLVGDTPAAVTDRYAQAQVAIAFYQTQAAQAESKLANARAEAEEWPDRYRITPEAATTNRLLLPGESGSESPCFPRPPCRFPGRSPPADADAAGRGGGGRLAWWLSRREARS